MKPRRGKRFRRFEDRAIVYALAGICVFQFIAIVVIGFGVLKNVSDLQAANDRFTKNVCIQASNTKTALDREERLSKTDVPRLRHTHAVSARRLRTTYIFLNSVVDCRGVKISVPVERPR